MICKRLLQCFLTPRRAARFICTRRGCSLLPVVSKLASPGSSGTRGAPAAGLLPPGRALRTKEPPHRPSTGAAHTCEKLSPCYYQELPRRGDALAAADKAAPGRQPLKRKIMIIIMRGPERRWEEGGDCRSRQRGAPEVWDKAAGARKMWRAALALR